MRAAAEGAAAAGRGRPALICAKYRLKEERRKVLKLSLAKLRRIDDPESCLRRSVLLHNCLRRLQRDARADRLLSRPRPAPAPSLSLSASPLAPTPGKENHRPPAPAPARDADVQAALSHFCLAPTPRLLSCIDDDAPCKRPRPSPADAAPAPAPQDVDMTLALRAADPGGAEARLSCGHASLLGAPAAVFHGLLASLET